MTYTVYIQDSVGGELDIVGTYPNLTAARQVYQPAYLDVVNTHKTDVYYKYAIKNDSNGVDTNSVVISNPTPWMVL